MNMVVADLAPLHLVGPDTTPAERERIELFRSGTPAAVRSVPPKRGPLAEQLAAFADPSRFERILSDSDTIHVWTRTHVPALIRCMQTRKHFSPRRPLTILHLDSGRNLHENVRLYFDCPLAGVRFACPSSLLRMAYQREGVSPGHIAVIPEIAPPIQAAQDRTTIREGLHIAPESFAILIAPPLTDQTRAALWGALMASKVYSRIRVIVFGGGAHANRLERFVRSVQGDPWTVFVRSAAAWPALVRAADLGLHVAGEATPRWGFLTLLRGGVPMVVRSTMDNREVLTDDRDALFVPTDAARQVAEAILRAIESPASLPPLAASAARRLAPFEPERVRAAFDRETLRFRGDLGG